MCNRNGDLPFIGHKMFSLKVLISVLLLEVLICSNWLLSTFHKRTTSTSGRSRTTVTSKMELFVAQINGLKSLTTVAGRGSQAFP